MFSDGGFYTTGKEDWLDRNGKYGYNVEQIFRTVVRKYPEESA